MKKILGLDLGTNSIGWALVTAEENNNKQLEPKGIEASGSRIIPIDSKVMGLFERGNSVSQTAERTGYRSMREMKERRLLRRERLNRVLSEIGFLPKHYAAKLDKYGKFIDNSEPKIAWNRNENGINEFLFKKSFNEMLEEFHILHPELVEHFNKIPYDWTLYYLRKKAIRERIEREELAWILFSFNQKRGYYQSMDEDTGNDDNSEVISVIVKDVVKGEKDKKSGKYEKYWYDVILDNGMEYRASFSNDISMWKGTKRDFILTRKDTKNGVVNTLSFLPTMDEIEVMGDAQKHRMYAKIKIKTEKEIESSNRTVGEYIYYAILSDPSQKIKGKLVRTIERDLYKNELKKILDFQSQYYTELTDREVYAKCVEMLYPSNPDHRRTIAGRDMTYLIMEDILFYQRPLKSQKSTVANCQYEYRCYVDDNSAIIKQPLKCAPKSNPYFQELRLWQFVSNLKIYQREKQVGDSLKTDVDVTSEFLKGEEDYVKLFEWLNDRKSVKQDDLLKFYLTKQDVAAYRWNYVEDKEYPCNETRSIILTKLHKAGLQDVVVDRDFEYSLWHIMYSVRDVNEFGKAIKTFAASRELGEKFIESVTKSEIKTSEYCAYSEKAIKKLLSLVRMGSKWSVNDIDANTKDRIEKLINGEYDQNIGDRVREKVKAFESIDSYRGLPLWLACYVVYGRHSESGNVQKWDSPEDIDKYLAEFKQHSMRNPIVEQVVTETLRVVRDIWEKYGEIDEIHVELGRSMKSNKEERERITKSITENENTNQRIRNLLLEFTKPEYEIKGVRPYSYSQQEKMKIYEITALGTLTKEDPNYEEINKISKKSEPTHSEILRYKLWLDQKYCSPYTGRMISLSKLFTSEYQIEHIIPQSVFFDDSFTNKVICESEVNNLKDNRLGYVFIKEFKEQIVHCAAVGDVRILSPRKYEELVKRYYIGKKRENLLLENIPDKFIERQMNDSRYISRFITRLLSNIVRVKDENGDYEQESVSKKLITCNGTITDRLKKDWGMNDVWNQLMLYRFKRLNEMLGVTDYTSLNTSGHLIPSVPMELKKSFKIKRIDHRHHAMDAIVIACTTRDHVRLLNNETAKTNDKNTKYELSRKLRVYRKEEILSVKNGVTKREVRDVPKEFMMPWNGFTVDVERALENIIVSFKQNLRVLNRCKSEYEKIEIKDGKLKKHLQISDEDKSGRKLFAIRKQLHKETYSGEVNLRMKKTERLKEVLSHTNDIVEKDLKFKLKELLAANKSEKEITEYFKTNQESWSDVNLNKIEVYYFTKDSNVRYFASRESLDDSYTADKIVKSITDTGIQKILLNYLEFKGGDPKVAFSPEGIEEMNKNISKYNGGKFHQPILKVRKYEKGEKFAVGQEETVKGRQFVEGAKGTNLFFAVIENEGERDFLTLPLNVIIDSQKSAIAHRIKYKDWERYLGIYLKKNGFIEEGWDIKFVLSPNDLVYLPTDKELLEKKIDGKIDRSRIYKMVSSSKKACFFIDHKVSNLICDKVEFTTSNKMERAITGEQIKKTCLPLIVDRLGNYQIIW